MNNIKIGDILEIEGQLGFLKSPKMIVIDVKEDTVLIESVDCGQRGLLSPLNRSWHSKDLISKKLKKGEL